MNTLDSILPELRSLLPASLRGAYLDGYLQRRRTPMELLLSRSLPNVDVAASTFEDVRAEIRTLGLPLWVANRYLAEAEQALAIGHDTREVIAAAKAWLATKPENPPEADVSLSGAYFDDEAVWFVATVSEAKAEETGGSVVGLEFRAQNRDAPLVVVEHADDLVTALLIAIDDNL